MRFIKNFIMFLIVAIILLFFIQNSPQLSYNFVFGLDLYVPGLKWESAGIPLFFVVLLAFLLGVLLCVVAFLPERIRSVRQSGRQRREMAKMEQELKALRQLPLLTENKPEVKKEELPQAQQAMLTSKSEV